MIVIKYISYAFDWKAIDTLCGTLLTLNQPFMSYLLSYQTADYLLTGEDYYFSYKLQVPSGKY